MRIRESLCLYSCNNNIQGHPVILGAVSGPRSRRRSVVLPSERVARSPETDDWTRKEATKRRAMQKSGPFNQLSAAGAQQFQSTSSSPSWKTAQGVAGPAPQPPAQAPVQHNNSGSGSLSSSVNSSTNNRPTRDGRAERDTTCPPPTTPKWEDFFCYPPSTQNPSIPSLNVGRQFKTKNHS